MTEILTNVPHAIDGMVKKLENPHQISEEQIATLKAAYKAHAAKVAVLSVQIEPFADAEAALPNAAFAPWS